MTMTAQRTQAIDFAAARRSMIDSQLRVSGINQPWVLAAINRIAREDYVPAAARNHAYIDRAIALENGHSIPSPLAQAMLLAEAAPTTDDKVLLVSSGSDYLAELVRPLAGTLDVISAAEATSLKKGMGQHTLLLIDGAVEHLPDGLTAELAEGGRIVTGLVERGVTRLATGRKIDGLVSLLPLVETGIPVLGEFAAPKGWSF